MNTIITYNTIIGNGYNAEEVDYAYDGEDRHLKQMEIKS